MNTTFFLSFFLGSIGTYIAVPLVIHLAKKFGLIDDPAIRYHPAHTHTGRIPRAGGLAIFIGVVIASIYVIPFSKLYFSTFLACALLIAMGLLDDKKDIPPFIRLGTNALAALIVIAGGAGIPFVTNPITGGVIPLDTVRLSLPFFPDHTILLWADIIAFVWIMWTMNIVGWSAGVDGQMPGFVSISALILGILSMRFSGIDPSQLPVTLLALIIAGAFAGFIPWNFYPQKIMPGYGGKTLAGFLLALLGILSYAKFGTALLVLGVPMMDAVWILAQRIIKKTSPVRADRNHLHHALLDLGWGRRRIALFYWGVSAILGAVALSVNSTQKLFAMLVVAITIGGFFLWVRFFSQFSKQHGQDNG